MSCKSTFFHVFLCFFPKPKVDSTLLSFEPKKKYFNLKNPNNLEKITKVFFNQRRKMIKNPLKQIFKNPYIIVQKLKLDTNLRSQNLSPLNYFEITKESSSLFLQHFKKIKSYFWSIFHGFS